MGHRQPTSFLFAHPLDLARRLLRSQFSLRTDQGPATPDLIANTAFRYLQTTSQWLEAREKALVARPQVLRTLVARARRATARKQVFSFLVAASSVSSRTTPRTRCAECEGGSRGNDGADPEAVWVELR